MGPMVALINFCRRRKEAALYVALFFLVLAAATGCQSSGGRAMTAENMVPPILYLSPGDTLEITFPGATNFSGIRRIGPEGTLTLPVIGQVEASNKTAGELEAELEQRYTTELQDHDVVVALAGSANVVYVGGSVARPGRVVLDRPLTALEAILEAGGFNPDANMKRVKVIRYEGLENTVYELNLEPVYNGGPVSPFYLKPRDVVNVPKKIQWF